MKDKPKATIGWVEPTTIPMTFAGYLQENLPEATFVDATEEIDVPQRQEEPLRDRDRQEDGQDPGR